MEEDHFSEARENSAALEKDFEIPDFDIGEEWWILN